MARAGQEIEFASDGEQARGYLSLPASGHGPGVLVIQEWWGLVDHIRALCDRLARAGFVSLAPDLYRGASTGDPDEAGRLMMDLEIPRAARDLDGAVRALLNHEAVDGSKVGAMGFCMGGQLALYAATRNPRIGAVVDFYGIHPNVTLDLSGLAAPVLGIFAENDTFVTPEAARKLESDLRSAGKQAHFKIFSGVDHAFMNDSRPDVYNAEAAERAWGDLQSFLRAELGVNERALVPTTPALPKGLAGWLPEPLRSLQGEIDARMARIPTHLNEYGVDPFGATPAFSRSILLPVALLYRYWLRVETHGIERVPQGRVLLIGNHAGNTFAYDGAMLGMAMLLEAEPPRMVRGMAEFYLPQIPFFTVLMHRTGSVVGTPENCVQLLENEEAVMVFPEGARGFVKPYTKRYQLQRFGLGFMRLALETGTPIVPIGIVGSEEQSPALLDVKWLGRLVGSPAFPITPTFPWLGLGGFVPLPVKFRLHFGEALRFEGDPSEDDATVEKKVAVVKDAIAKLIDAGLAERQGWFG